MFLVTVFLALGVLFYASVIAPIKSAKEEKKRDDDRRNALSQKKWR